MHGLGNPFSIYTADQQETLSDKAVNQADYEYVQAQLENTARLTFLATRLALSISTPPANAIREDDDYTGEIPPEVKALSSEFAGLPLRHKEGKNEMYRDQIQIEDGSLKIRKAR